MNQLDTRLRAVDRMSRIRRNLSAAAEEYLQALHDEDWKALGYDTVEAWREVLLADMQLGRGARKTIVQALTADGQTARQISAATGASLGTVVTDQREVFNPEHQPPPASPRQQASRAREAARPRPAPKPAPAPGPQLPPLTPAQAEHAALDKAVRYWRDQGMGRDQIVATLVTSSKSRVWDSLNRLEGEDRARRNCTCGGAY